MLYLTKNQDKILVLVKVSSSGKIIKLCIQN